MFLRILSICIIFSLINFNRIENVEAFTVKSLFSREESSSTTEAPITNSNVIKENESILTLEDPMEDDEIQHEDNNNGHYSNMLKKCDPCPESILCVPQIQCPAHVRMSEQTKPQVCDLPGGKFGFCCVTGQNHTAKTLTMERSGPSNFVSMSIVEEARRKFESLMHHIAGLPVQRGRPEFLHSIVFHSSPQEDIQNFQITNNAIEQLITTQVFSKKEHIPMDDIITNNVQIDFKDTPLEKHCSEPHQCRNSKSLYRAFDGFCNNPLPHRSHWGAAGQPLERLLPPAYEDGIWSARLHSHDGKPLTSARQVSRLLLSDLNRPHSKYNLLLMQFGQFLAHDVSQTASVRTEGGELVSCCERDGSAVLPREKSHFACMPIEVESDDDFFGRFNVRCMNFVRLSLSPNNDCKSGYGKQRSKVTHFLDASPVYGSSVETMRELRTFHGGRLRMLHDFGHDLLPLTKDKAACQSEEPGQSCFKSGDGRTNQIISLIAVHIIFAREHNRIADALAHINPRASDEKLFQEARRILIAEMQHIVFNEYLPAVIGPVQMKRFRLVPQHHGYSNDYSVDVNPAITNEFSGAAFRMGHSTVDGKLHIHESGHGGHKNVDEVINIPDVMFNPSRMRKPSFFDQILNGMVNQPMQKVDSFISHGLTQFLFRAHNPFGLDLAAINIQRGRDQGIRPYNDYLELTGHRKIRDFHQIHGDIGRRLSQVYHSPDDIDFWVGGLLEKSVQDGTVGITFAEIIADQFSRFKRGDRYYYEYSNGVNPGAFTMDQLHQIRKASMARLLCDNADHSSLREIPLAAFIRSDLPGNQAIRCDSPHIPSVDLEAWRI